MANPLGNNGGRFYSFLNRPVLIDCSFTVASSNANGLGISGLKGMGVRNVFMHTSVTAGSNRGLTNPNPASGYALVQLDSNYSEYCGGFSGFVAPNTGSNLAINATALTAGNPYVITGVGAGSAGTATIAPVADVSGNLASTYFSLFDSYGNVFILYFIVNGVGVVPNVAGIKVPIVIATGATAATIGAALVTAIAALPSGISGVFSFTASGTTTVTVVGTAAVPLAGVPMDGVIATGFTFALTKFKTNNQNWANVGLNKGVVPSIGAAFIATASGDASGGTSSGTVAAVGVNNIQSIQVIGLPNQSMSPIPVGGSPNNGGLILVQFVAPTSSSVTTPVATAPTDGNIIQMSFYMNVSSIRIDGE